MKTNDRSQTRATAKLPQPVLDRPRNVSSGRDFAAILSTKGDEPGPERPHLMLESFNREPAPALQKRWEQLERERDSTPGSALFDHTISLEPHRAAPTEPQAVARAQIDPQFDRIIQEIAVAQDAHRRKVITMKLEVPGHGMLRVRVRQTGHGAEVRFTTDRRLSEILRRRRGEFTSQSRARGVEIASVTFR